MARIAAKTWPWLPQWLAAAGSPTPRHYLCRLRAKQLQAHIRTHSLLSHPPLTLLSVHSAQKGSWLCHEGSDDELNAHLQRVFTLSTPFLFKVRPQHQPYLVRLRLIVLQQCFQLPHSLHILRLLFVPWCLPLAASLLCMCPMRACVQSLLSIFQHIFDQAWLLSRCRQKPRRPRKHPGPRCLNRKRYKPLDCMLSSSFRSPGQCSAQSTLQNSLRCQVRTIGTASAGCCIGRRERERENAAGCCIGSAHMS